MKTLTISVLALALSATAALAEFRLSFEWGDIPLCTTGRPNTVGNPAFTLRDVPAGTETIEFRLVDLDVPSYNHGGGRLRISGSGTVPEGLFTYRSPCPPGEVHTYEWQATARAGRQVLGVATAQRRYPE
ncbi:phospholipid-binding protein [Roseobacter sp. HKCCD9010]|uniref:phospholipid-binding protein n=1 Tax=unclassified Roseobacter TaxID=196798 RepID=UPI001491396D|nr:MULTISPECIES: phospholipid-binding protein [unclassified Roseobacter]MBF9048579.1 phospholipid-binding protein [Rhodobacterales bacterium HKCCD4356]NNV10578.1 phospholipid-binding protein [Roseobacter sp. HKCCD7357]NNV14763.1 phospholipid-binding protein [Roseobacter sp. HKCCD8768]NNV24222.1 phospholipid-binding protein [Roseobacter sp. HKCCD8192]NNV28479.1 phospholipid-binding protein [Roseobacter sp. HKCCD9061]